MAKNLNDTTMKKRPLYSQEIKDLIMQAVINGELKPGDRVVETRWAKNLGVSQAPVREAIRELEVMGLIENRPYQGAYVREINKQDIIDSYNVRMTLEILALQYAVRMITPEQLEELHTLLVDMKQAVKDEEFDLFIEKDSLFHQRMMEVSQNRLLIQLWEQCRIREYTRISSATSHVGLEELAERHTMLYEALAKKDEAMLIQEMHRHFELLIDEIRVHNFTPEDSLLKVKSI